jgi:hypothetical protein
MPRRLRDVDELAGTGLAEVADPATVGEYRDHGLLQTGCSTLRTSYLDARVG